MNMFTANVILGAGRGKGLGTPTLNLRLEDIPASLGEGIYACTISVEERATSNEQRANLPAVAHYGPRPVFNDSRSFEVHVLDVALGPPPQTVTVEIVARLRDVADFLSEEALKAQIAEDIESARTMFDRA